MSIYQKAKKIFPHNLGENYSIYIRFNPKVDPSELAKSLNRRISDFGTDKNNSLSMTFFYKNICKNFMLEMKRLILKDPDIKEVSIRQVKV